MKNLLRLFLAASLVCPVALRAETEASTIECLKSRWFLAPLESSEHRKYAPDREVQVLHLALDISPDFKRRSFIQVRGDQIAGHPG